jgi:hypothetical protein
MDTERSEVVLIFGAVLTIAPSFRHSSLTWYRSLYMCVARISISENSMRISGVRGCSGSSSMKCR